MAHDLEMNFNKIAPFAKEDTAKELHDHAADVAQGDGVQYSAPQAVSRR